MAKKQIFTSTVVDTDTSGDIKRATPYVRLSVPPKTYLTIKIYGSYLFIWKAKVFSGDRKENLPNNGWL